MTTYTVVPDIHADAARLEASIAKRAPGDRIAFLGDFIDGGKVAREHDDEAVLRRVRSLIEDHDAIAVMGNHELNAILFHRLGPDGTPMRGHEEKNRTQHRTFLDSFGVATPASLEWTEWFLTLPLWRDLGGLRLVHAFWGQADIDTIAQRRPDGRLKEEDLPEIAEESTEFGRAVKSLVNGPELPLPAGYQFRDTSDHPRTDVRIAWWQPEARTWREAALSVPDVTQLPETEIPASEAKAFYDDTAPPVLVGHYKMTGEPRITSSVAACLDYPESPCVYRWTGRRQLDADELVLLD